MVDIHGTSGGTYYAVGAWNGAIYKSADRMHWVQDFGGALQKLGLGAIWADAVPMAVGQYPIQQPPYQALFKPALFTRENGVWTDSSLGFAGLAGDGVLLDIWRSPGGTNFLVHRQGVLADIGGVWKQVANAPVDYSLRAIWGSADDNVIVLAVPNSPIQLPHLAMRFDGKSWSQEVIGQYAGLEAIHGSAANNIYVVGGNHQCGAISKSAIARFDGLKWRHVAEVPENAGGVWTGGPQDVWIVGNDPCSPTMVGGMVLHYDGSTMRKESFPKVTTAIWGITQRSLVIASEKMIYWRRCP